jgi:hypothetical protein
MPKVNRAEKEGSAWFGRPLALYQSLRPTMHVVRIRGPHVRCD